MMNISRPSAQPMFSAQRTVAPERASVQFAGKPDKQAAIQSLLQSEATRDENGSYTGREVLSRLLEQQSANSGFLKRGKVNFGVFADSFGKPALEDRRGPWNPNEGPPPFGVHGNGGTAKLYSFLCQASEVGLVKKDEAQDTVSGRCVVVAYPDDDSWSVTRQGEKMLAS